nr:MAG TPA: hypothetical protein [Caudoviricetes sp.]
MVLLYYRRKSETAHFVGCLFYAQNLATKGGWTYWAKSTTEIIC